MILSVLESNPVFNRFKPQYLLMDRQGLFDKKNLTRNRELVLSREQRETKLQR
jgi:hypothetical protein